MKSPIALLSDLFYDIERSNPGVKGLKRDFITLTERFEHEGFGFLTKTLPALDEALLLGISTRRFACPTGFARIRGGTIPRFLSGMFCKVFDPVTGELAEPIDLCVLTDLHQLLRFFKKTRLDADDEELLHQKALREFYQCDGVAARVVIPDRHGHLIGRVSRLILNNLNSKEIENAIYKHGPGAVQEGIKGNQKWLSLDRAARRGDFGYSYGIWGSWMYNEDLDLRYIEKRDGPSPYGEGRRTRQSTRTRDVGTDLRQGDNRLLDRSSTQSFRRLRVHVQRSSESIEFVGTAFVNTSYQVESTDLGLASCRSAKLTSVLKNSTSRRTITIEPLLKQYVQQGLGSVLRDSINECRILRNCIALTNQGLNQELALEGSRYDNWATLDLKSASDLLSLRLVETVFGHHDIFYRHVIECRTPTVQVKGFPDLELGKFAGMGNALTFPIQSVCFAVVCIAAILSSEGVNPTYGRVLRAARRLRIYGDDIIVDSKYAHQCVDWLQSVGLLVNTKKSFLTGNFKESCGLEAYKGVVITPSYIKDRPDLIDAPPNVIDGFISLSNALWLRGYYRTATGIQNMVESQLRRRLPLVKMNSGSFGWHTRLDASAPHKWCRRTHRFLTRTLALAPIKKDDKLDGSAALLKCLSMKSDDQTFTRDGVQKDQTRVLRSLFPEPLALDKDHLSRSTMRYSYRIVRRWVAA